MSRAPGQGRLVIDPAAHRQYQQELFKFMERNAFHDPRVIAVVARMGSDALVASPAAEDDGCSVPEFHDRLVAHWAASGIDAHAQMEVRGGGRLPLHALVTAVVAHWIECTPTPTTFEA